MLHGARANDRTRHAGTVAQPQQSELSRREPAGIAELADRIRHRERTLGEAILGRRHALRARSLGRLRRRPVPTGEDAPGQWRPGQQREAVPKRERDELVLDAPVEQVVRRLLADIASPAALVAHREALVLE